MDQQTNTDAPRRRGRRPAAEKPNDPPDPELTKAANELQQQHNEHKKEEQETSRRRSRREAAESYRPPVGSGVSADGKIQAAPTDATLELLEQYYKEVERNEEAKEPLREQLKALNLGNSTVYRKVKALGIRKQAFVAGLYRRKLTKEECKSLDLEMAIAARAAHVPIQAELDLFGAKALPEPQTVN